MRESQKKEDTVGRNVRKVANRCVFSMICGSGGWKRRLAKAAGAEPRAEQILKMVCRCAAKRISKSKCGTRLWRKAHFQVRMKKKLPDA